MTELNPIIHITYFVNAYDDSGYGDNRSKDFKDRDEAIKYARSLDKRFSPSILKRITMDPMTFAVDWKEPVKKPLEVNDQIGILCRANKEFYIWAVIWLVEKDIAYCTTLDFNKTFTVNAKTHEILTYYPLDKKIVWVGKLNYSIDSYNDAIKHIQNIVEGQKT